MTSALVASSSGSPAPLPSGAAAPASRAAAPPRRRERNAEETRRRILDAAEAEFAAKGFDGARLGGIARAADVQAALIHHYFADKEGLYGAVLSRGLATMGAQGVSILGRLGSRLEASEIRPLTEAFTHLLIRFYAENAPILAILRHDAGGGPRASGARDDHASLVAAVVADHIKPVFDAVVAYIEEMKRRRLIRADVDPRHLCVSALALAGAPFQDERLIAGVWPVDVRAPEFLAAREREIVDLVIARVLPSGSADARTPPSRTRVAPTSGGTAATARATPPRRSPRRR